MRVRYADLAADEVEEILAYLRERSPQAADGFLRQLGQIERMLGQFPWAGTVTSHVWLRRMPVRQYPYIIFYEVIDDEVIVLAVRHSARDPSSMPGRE